MFFVFLTRFIYLSANKTSKLSLSSVIFWYSKHMETRQDLSNKFNLVMRLVATLPGTRSINGEVGHLKE